MLGEVLPNSCDARCKLNNQRNTSASGLNNSSVWWYLIRAFGEKQIWECATFELGTK